VVEPALRRFTNHRSLPAGSVHCIGGLSGILVAQSFQECLKAGDHAFHLVLSQFDRIDAVVNGFQMDGTLLNPHMHVADRL
jgi:hypothetical protein